MTRTLWLVTLVGISLSLGGCAANDKRHDKPPIVEVFACSDYCPGPEAQYLRKVYEGVADKAACEAIGGRPYVYIGWGSTFICLAN